ncbi:unnamed protein product, partial [Symbiodinium microadriaticum]
AEQISHPCEAVLIGLELQGKPRALAPRLLVDDLQLSDLGGAASTLLKLDVPTAQHPHMGKRNEDLRLKVLLRTTVERAAVKDGIRRRGCKSLCQFMYSEPKYLEETGISIQVTQVAPQHWDWLKEWEGREVKAKDTTSASLRPEQLRQLIKELVLLPPDEGLVLVGGSSGPGEDFGTPPRPPVISVTSASVPARPEGGPPPDIDGLSLHESFRDARAHGATVGEAIALVSSAYNIGPEVVQLSVLGALEGNLKQKREYRRYPQMIPLRLARLVRKAGASFGEQLGASNPTLARDRIIHAIDGLRKAQDEDKTGTKGQVSSIKEGEKLDVFLARGRGQLSIELCKDVYAVRIPQHQAILITNRVALSIAGLWWGGTENFTLLASDCATARVEQIENWSPPTEHKIEARSKPPTTFLTWLRYAENSIKVFGSAYGLALAPSSTGQANFQFPRVWDLADPAGYYQRVILPRQNKAMARLLNKQLHDHVTKEKRPDHRKTAGPTDAPAADQGDVPSQGAEGADKLNMDEPLGLSPAEVKRSVQHAPQSTLREWMVELPSSGPKLKKSRITRGLSRNLSRSLGSLLRALTLSGAEVTAVQAKTDEAHQRKAAYDKLLACKRLEPISGCSDHLHSHVAAHFVNAELQGGQVQLSEVLTQAVDYGHPQLADEAQRHNRTVVQPSSISEMQAQLLDQAPCGGPPIPLVEGQDAPEFAVKLAGLIILSLAMPFGWVGSPGEFVAWSAAAKAHHGSFRPMEPRFNDVVPFESKWLMDDGVAVEPMVGNRVFDSLAVLDETMQLVWGPEGVNVEKMAEEGEPSTTQLLWGLHMNFDLQEVEASGPEEEDRRWEDFWDALDFIRLQLASPPGLGSQVVTPRWNGLERKAQVFHAERVDQYREGLRKLAREGDETDIISVMELLAFVVLACHRRGDWGGELVLYVTDNMNVKTGCQSPCPASPEDAKRSALVYPTGEDPQGQTARSASGWRGNLCMLKTTQRDPTGRERKRLRQVLRGDSSRLQKLVVDCPRQFDIHWLEKLLVDYFPSVESCRYISSHLGAVTARRRALVFGWKDTTPPPTQLDRYRANPPPSMQMIPLDGIITTGDPWLRHLKGPGVPPKCL